MPIIAAFALTWLPRMPRRALPILALQIAAALAAVGSVVVFGL